jgi:hypothetical protein
MNPQEAGEVRRPLLSHPCTAPPSEEPGRLSVAAGRKKAARGFAKMKEEKES